VNRAHARASGERAFALKAEEAESLGGIPHLSLSRAPIEQLAYQKNRPREFRGLSVV
jgi:hypothetical protein